MSKRTKVALIGAGGKMGMRLTANLSQHPDFDMAYLETGQAGIERLATLRLEPATPQDALPNADVVILALPDTALGPISHEIAPILKSGAIIVTLDPAAAHAGVLTERKDLSLFVTHPCHPPIFGDEVGEARKDYFGGVLAKQAIVCALLRGDESAYDMGEKLAMAMYAPVTRSHRVTVEQMAILEPAMAETVAACCMTIVREAMDEAIARGVPPEAARDFMLGHVNIPLAIVFGEVGSPFSDGAKKIIEYGRQHVFRPDWKKVFEPDNVLKQVQTIVENHS